MFVYVGRNYTATVSGQTLRAVVCERCGGEYFYSACRITTGAGTSPYGLDNRGAEQRAHDRAQKALSRSLRGAVDVVPCPHCGWLQHDMVLAVRRGRYASLQKAAWVLSLLVLVPLVIALLASIDARWQDDVRPGLQTAIAVVVAAAVAAVAWIAMLRRRFDPNERAPGGQLIAALPPAPPALVRTPWPPQAGAEPAEPDDGVEPSDTDGPRTLDYYAVSDAPARAPAEAGYAHTHTLLLPSTSAYSNTGPSPVKGGWVTLQLPKVGWPDACELCLGDATTTYANAVPFKISDSIAPLPVPLCEGCRRALRRRWWKWAAIAVLAVGVLAAAGYLFLPVDQIGRTIVCAILGPLAAVVAVPILAGVAARPHRCKAVDAGRGFYRLWFENTAYSGLMAAAWTAPETHALAVANEQLDELAQTVRPPAAPANIPLAARAPARTAVSR